MVFWASVLAFIAGIMTYMMYPRNDQYVQEMHKSEYAVTAFVNQHQAARDYMYQMIEWHPSTQISSQPSFHLFPYEGLKSMLPYAQRSDDINEIYTNSSRETALNPNPTEDTAGQFTSVLVCLDDKLENMTECPSGRQYVLTYGYQPGWWSSRTAKNDTWRKAILKRTRGSASCGTLYPVISYSSDSYYAIDTTQKLTGVVKYKPLGSTETYKIIPPPITTYMVDTVSLDAGGGAGEKLRDLMFCLSPVGMPYHTDGLLFMIDKLNNTGHGNVNNSEAVEALRGVLSDGIAKPGSNNFNETSYTISGVVQGTGAILSGSVTVSTSCSTNEGVTTCSLTVDGLTAGNFQVKGPFSFTYVGEKGSKKLYINGELKATSSNDATKLESVQFDNGVLANNNATLLHLRIYTNTLSDTQIRNNYRADKKRFGL